MAIVCITVSIQATGRLCRAEIMRIYLVNDIEPLDIVSTAALIGIVEVDLKFIWSPGVDS